GCCPYTHLPDWENCYANGRFASACRCVAAALGFVFYYFCAANDAGQRLPPSGAKIYLEPVLVLGVANHSRRGGAAGRLSPNRVAFVCRSLPVGCLVRTSYRYPGTNSPPAQRNGCCHPAQYRCRAAYRDYQGVPGTADCADY